MPRIVVLRGDPEIADVLRELLEGAGHEVMLGVPRDTASDALRHLRIAVVIADGLTAARNGMNWLSVAATCWVIPG